MPSAERSSGTDARPNRRIIDARHRFNGLSMDKTQEDLSIFEGKSVRYVSSPSPKLTREDEAEARAILAGTKNSRLSFADRVKSWFGLAKKTALEITHDHELSPEDREVQEIVAKLTAPREQPARVSVQKPNPRPVQIPKPI